MIEYLGLDDFCHRTRESSDNFGQNNFLFGLPSVVSQVLRVHEEEC